jgi:hypothetical protein
VDEHVRLPIALVDKSEASGNIEELYGSCVHGDFLSIGTKGLPLD